MRTSKGAETGIGRRAFTIGCVAMIAACGLTTLRGVEILQKLELTTYDVRMRASPMEASDEILVVAIDEHSIREIAEWPWRRSIHARLIEKLNEAGAKLIVFDVVMSEPSSFGVEEELGFEDDVPLEDWGESESPEDEALAQAIREAGNVILAATFIMPEEAPGEGDLSATIVDAEFPYAAFDEGALAVGPTNIPRDADNVVRRYWLSLEHQDADYPTMATCAAAEARGIDAHELAKRLAPPVTSGLPPNQMLLKFSPTSADEGGFDQVSYHDVLIGRAPTELIRDRIILVGATAQILQDLWQTPMVSSTTGRAGEQTVELVPGGVVQATAVQCLLNETRILPCSPGFSLLIALCAAGLVGISLVLVRPLLAVVVGLLPVCVGVLLVGASAFASRDLWIPVAVPGLAALATYIGGTTYRFMVEEGARRQMKKAWQKRVSPQVLDLILNNPDLAKVESKEVYATVLFSDIRGYTTLSAERTPKEVVDLLNVYLTRMTAAIMGNGGTINKFLGDGIMAVFGDPVPYPDHALRAARAAVQMQEELATMREETDDDGIKALFMRVGLHTGEMMAGDIGSEDMLEYTLIGDTVNTASRLESLGKEFDTQILISADTFAHVEGQVKTRYLGEVTVRNRPEPIGVHELLEVNGSGEANTTPPEADDSGTGPQ